MKSDFTPPTGKISQINGKCFSLIGNQVSASSSNRNFKGRQGSPSGRTLLMSPAMVAAAAINGKVSDVREFIN